MSNVGGGKRPEFVDVVPVNGKYCEFMHEGNVYKVWRVHPGTPDKFGTPIPYGVAVHFLAQRTPNISVILVDEGGKKVSPILPEDQEKIKQATALGFTYCNYNSVSGSGVDSAVLARALDSVAKQKEENARLQASLAEAVKSQSQLLQRLEALEKKGTGTPAA